MHQKSQSSDAYFLRYGLWQTFFVILGHFLHFKLQQPRKSKFWKNEKNAWWYYPFTYVYHKLRSYGEWFLRHSVIKRTFCHFEPFFTLSPPSTKKTKVLKKIWKAWKYHPFTNVHHKWRSYDVRFLSYGPQKMNFLSFWAIFYPFTPLTTKKMKIT